MKKITIRDKIIKSHHYLEDLSGSVEIKLNGEIIWFQEHDGFFNQIDNLEEEIVDMELRLASYKHALIKLKNKKDSLWEDVHGKWHLEK